MLKIVEIHVCAVPEGEYVVLQNQGTLTVPLKGCALCSDSYDTCDPHLAAPDMYIFSEDAIIKPYGRVVLFTGRGTDGWQPTTDGRRCFVAYWNREEPVWSRRDRVHLLRVACSQRVVNGLAASLHG